MKDKAAGQVERPEGHGLRRCPLHRDPGDEAVHLVRPVRDRRCKPGVCCRHDERGEEGKATVTASEFSFKLSRLTVAPGVVTFVVTNKGKLRTTSGSPACRRS